VTPVSTQRQRRAPIRCPFKRLTAPVIQRLENAVHPPFSELTYGRKIYRSGGRRVNRRNIAVALRTPKSPRQWTDHVTHPPPRNSSALDWVAWKGAPPACQPQSRSEPTHSWARSLRLCLYVRVAKYSFPPFKRSLYSPVGKGWISSTAEIFTTTDRWMRTKP
jgi:hypothetical protein